ncbi:protein-L-isoaspartate O-methyltransferase domain-containing protein 1-like [Palaemon carinicauda]|uniref:protein-L-isoaspartate O-methyltransferase domain-containing protein 1-like n=1 Tax=Palaemon carinicauda TaxID=392227 RepID=UPI0035B64F0F
MGGAVSAGVDNDDLVDNLKAANYIKTPLVERIFRAVDRGDYFTVEHREQAYRDNAWKKGNLHLSAPCIYAKVMESLQLAPGHSFLNLGSGTGYLSTMAGLIIGPYGINHGVELHADVLAYGLDRLEDLKKTAALDAFSFCTPQFVQGNCLCLPPDIRMYDRVYCGASCPETHENYMKGLIKEGGVLVMPLNDQLVKITRTGPTTWETISLLPVSFSSLVMPDASHPPASVPLPEVELLDLQDMCRQEVRSILRANINVEHPELATAANRPVQKPRSRCRQQFPGVFVPYMPVPFFESEDETGLTSDDNMEDTRENLITFGSPRRNQLTTVIEFAQSLAGQRLLERELQNMRRQNQPEEDDANKKEEEEEEEEEEVDDDSPDSASSDSEDEKQETEMEVEGKSSKGPNLSVPLRSFFLKKGKVRKEPEEIKVDPAPSNGEAATSAPTVPQSDPIPMTSTPVIPVKSNKKREKFDSGVGDEIENGKGPSSEESDQGEEGDVEMDLDSTDSDFSDGSPARPRLRNRTRNKVSRLLDPDDPDCPCGGHCSDSWKDRKNEETKEDGESQSNASPPAESYSTYMREKIGQLPLPQALKLYLNYYREL